MTAIEQAQAAMQRTIQLTKGLSTGHVPGPVALFDNYRDLVDSYSAVAEEQSRKFSAKEKAYLTRKIQEAKQYRSNRYNADGTKTGMSGSDAEVAAKLSVGEEADREIESASEFEQYRLLLGSLDRAIDYVRSLCSFVKNEERGTGSSS